MGFKFLRFRIGRNRSILKIYRAIRRDARNTLVPIVTNATAPAVIWRDIDKRIVRLRIKKRGAVRIAKRFMCLCPRSLCTSAHIIRDVGAPTAGNAFPGLGCFKDTFVPTQVCKFICFYEFLSIFWDLKKVLENLTCLRKN